MKILVLVLALLATQCLTSPALDQRDLPVHDIFQTLETDAHAVPTEHKAEQTIGTAMHASTTQTASSAHTTSEGLGLLGHLGTSSGLSSVAKETSGHGSGTSKSLSTSPTSYSVIGTIPPLPSYPPHTTAAFSVVQTPTTAQATATSTPSTSSPPAKQSSASREWKIIGVAVIAFSTVAAILLLAVFFDSWTRFLKDLFFRRKSKEGTEELVPDWEKGSWDVRLGTDRHRYPSFASLPSEMLMQGLGFVSPSSTNESGNLNAKGALERTASTRIVKGYPREKETELPTAYPLNPQPYRPPVMNAIANQYVSPKIPAPTRSHSRSHSRRNQSQRGARPAENPFEDPPKSPGMTSIYGGIAS